MSFTPAMQIVQTEIREHSGLKYRIQMRCNQGIWQQRHIWYPAPETYVDEETADEWIKSGTGNRGPQLTEGFEPV